MGAVRDQVAVLTQQVEVLQVQVSELMASAARAGSPCCALREEPPADACNYVESESHEDVESIPDAPLSIPGKENLDKTCTGESHEVDGYNATAAATFGGSFESIAANLLLGDAEDQVGGCSATAAATSGGSFEGIAASVSSGDAEALVHAETSGDGLNASPRVECAEAEALADAENGTNQVETGDANHSIQDADTSSCAEQAYLTYRQHVPDGIRKSRESNTSRERSSRSPERPEAYLTYRQHARDGAQARREGIASRDRARRPAERHEDSIDARDGANRGAGAV